MKSLQPPVTFHREAAHGWMELANHVDAREVILKIIAPLLEMLDGMPKTFAIQANPTGPQMTEEAAREALDNVYRMIQMS